MFKKFIPALFVFTCSFLANGSSWEEEVDSFVVRRLSDLRASRSLVKREKLGIGLATELLDFTIEGMRKHGVEAVANSDHTAELVVDLSDIINLQTPDFKNRYDIFVEQWVKKGVQKSFSLFTFDRVAQAFKHRDRIFNKDLRSPYSRWIEIIFREEVPNLYRTMRLIRDLEIVRGRITGIPNSHRGYGFFHERTDEEQRLLIISGHLDKIDVLSGAEKDRKKVLVRRIVSCCGLSRLSDLTAMAHDYFVLERIEKSADIVLAIPSYNTATERQAFLAGMIQIGELATNKNLSKFIKAHSERIPWNDLIHIRDAIEHQDENGFSDFFEGIISGTDTYVSFTSWRRELETLKTQVSGARLLIWGDTPKVTYDTWIEAELVGSPVYGVINVVDVVPVSKDFRKTFRSTDVFRYRQREWSEVLNAARKVEFRDLFQINQLLKSAQITDLREQLFPYLRIRRALSQMLRQGQVQYIEALNDINKKIMKKQKYLKDLEGIQSYLYERLRKESVHLTEGEKELLIETINSNLDKEDIVKICLGLLNKDRLDPRNGRAFLETFINNEMDYKPFGRIYTRIHPVMHLTRRVAGTLGYDPSKDMDQLTRRDFSLGQLRKTQKHLHDMAHGGPRFQEEMLGKLNVLPIQYAFTKAAREAPEVMAEQERIGEIHEQYGTPDEYGYYQLSEEGSRLAREEMMRIGTRLTLPSLTDPEFIEFSRKTMDDFYRRAHQFHLPTAIHRNPTSYLASVYTLSVGLGGFKAWLTKESSPPVDEVKLFEELREERNFMAHGDILREMHNIDLGKVQIEVLTGYLGACRRVGVS